MENNSSNRSICIPENNLPLIVVIGAGFAGINFIKKLDSKPVQIVLLDQNNFHQFQPLLYQVAISGLEPDAIITPIRKLFKTCVNMVYRMTKVNSIDTSINRVQTEIGYVDYDYLLKFRRCCNTLIYNVFCNVVCCIYFIFSTLYL